jgi:hypothetical protein
MLLRACRQGTSPRGALVLSRFLSLSLSLSLSRPSADAARCCGVVAGWGSASFAKFECQSPSPPRSVGAPSQRSILTSCVAHRPRRRPRRRRLCRNWETSRGDEAVAAASTMSPVGGGEGGEEHKSSAQLSHTSRPPAHWVRDLGGLKRVLGTTSEQRGTRRARLTDRGGAGGWGHCNYDNLGHRSMRVGRGRFGFESWSVGAQRWATAAAAAAAAPAAGGGGKRSEVKQK